MPTDWLHPALRLTHYALLLGLFGTLAFHTFGLRHRAVEPDLARVPAIVIAALAAPFVSLALMLVGIAAMMGQTAWMVEWSAIKSMILTTDMGWAFLARMGLLLAGIAALLLIRNTRNRRTAGALCYGLAIVTLAWSGHAAATEGVLGLLHRLNDSLHLLAAGLWIGAIGGFTALVFDAHKSPDRRKSERLREAMEGFAPIGITLVSIVAVTGAINVQFIVGIENTISVLATGYGWLLAAKVLLVVLMVICAARHAHLARRKTDGDGAQRVATDVPIPALRSSLATELLLAVCVLAIVAITGLASPMG